MTTTVVDSFVKVNIFFTVQWLFIETCQIGASVHSLTVCLYPVNREGCVQDDENMLLVNEKFVLVTKTLISHDPGLC